MWLSPTLSLHNVLFVSALHCNLLSVSILTRELHCYTIFSSSSCVFQDLASERTIGNADWCAGLYLLELKPLAAPPVPGASSSSISAFQIHKDTDILLWHLRLGLPNFVYLKQLFLSLFNNKMVTSPFCDVCQLSKHTRSIFHNNRTPPHPHLLPSFIAISRDLLVY